MPELPEITVISRQMNQELSGKKIDEVEVRQPKNLNIPVDPFIKTVKGKTIGDISNKGKWIFTKLDPDYLLLLNLGMGGDLIYYKPRDPLPKKYQFRISFSDQGGFTALFWWFGYIHLVNEKNLYLHKMTSRLGTQPTDEKFTHDFFRALLITRKGRIKNFLMDQKNIAGIGNVYIQDILFKARLHPDRLIPTLSDAEIKSLYMSIKNILNRSIRLGGLAYEKDFYGRKGRFTSKHFLVGYKTGKPCPECKTSIEKIKTGSTSTYICPKCQLLV